MKLIKNTFKVHGGKKDDQLVILINGNLINKKILKKMIFC